MIALEHICVAFGGLTVLQDFSLQLSEQGIVTLSGPSGCGKTTAARVLAFLQKPDSGRVTGIAPGEVSVLFQEDRLLNWRTARQNVELVSNRERAELWLRRMELEAEADQYPATMSGGMQRRVALARALAYESRLLILDEPFKGLDEALRARLYPFVRETARQRPVLMITHDEDEAEALADFRLHFDGPPLRRRSD